MRLKTLVKIGDEYKECIAKNKLFYSGFIQYHADSFL